MLALADRGLHMVGTPPLLSGGLVVALWVWLTGGLHLDGAMDTADGLAVMDPERRLEVMADSRTGAFGTMVAIAILGLKTLALGELTSYRALILLVTPLWGRWGQVVAIARYPYLKAEGKGAFHKASMRLPQDLLIGIITALLLHGLHGWLYPNQTLGALMMFPAGVIVAVTTAAWFNRSSGGTYRRQLRCCSGVDRGFATLHRGLALGIGTGCPDLRVLLPSNDGFGFIQG